MIGLLVAVFVLLFLGRDINRFLTRGTMQRERQLNWALVQIIMFREPLDKYQVVVGRYPTTEQGLQALCEPPADLIDADPDDWPFFPPPVPNDPWGNPFQYKCPGRFNTDGYDVWSFGPDRTDGTDDDVCNWRRSTRP